MPTAVIYVAAVITTVAAVLAFKEFVYDPHIEPFFEDLKAQREASQRQRAQPHREQPRPAYTDKDTDSDADSQPSVRDFSRAPRDEKAERERRAAAASAWRKLSESVATLDSQRESEKADASGSGVDAVAPSSAGLRRRTAGPMDASIESLLFAPMSPTPTPPPPSRGVRSPSPVRPASPGETLFSASTLSSPELAPRLLSSPRSPSPGLSAHVLSPDPFSDPWATDSLAASAVFLSPAQPATNLDALAGSEFLMPDGAMSPRAVLAAADVLSPLALSPAAGGILSPFTQASGVGTDVDELSLLDADEVLSVESLSDHSSDSDGEHWSAARREALP